MTLSKKVGSKMGQFTIEILGSSGGRRIGTLLEDADNFTLTPGFLIHTLAGSVPHLTREAFEMVFSRGSHPLQISVDTTYPFHEHVKPSGRTISQFVGLPANPAFLTVHNPLRELSPGFNSKSGVSIWSRQGRQTISNMKFIQIVNDFRPTFHQTLSDYDVSRSSSVKRIRKSIARNITYMNEAIKGVENAGRAFVTIEAAWFLVCPTDAEAALCEFLEQQNHIAGFVINGATTPGEGIDSSVLSSIVSKLPANKPRFVPGAFQPHEIMDLVKCGVDLFDSSSVTQIAENGTVYHFQLDKFIAIPPAPATSANEPLIVKLNGESEGSIKNDPAQDDSEDDVKILLHLKDKRYFNDFSPISTTCDCYTCRKFTRAYLHHLLSTSELLGPVLLMMHNLIQLELFFKVLRHVLPDEEKFNELYNHLSKSAISSVPSANSDEAFEEKVLLGGKVSL